MPRRRKWNVKKGNNLLVSAWRLHVFEVLCEGFARDSEAVAVQEPAVKQQPQHTRQPANGIQVHDVVLRPHGERARVWLGECDWVSVRE